ncbi:MAG: hypothetical protein ACXV75_15685 [Candidatus Angelobacter sp.]
MPETSNAILEAKRRARDYWDIDGLPALLAGATTVLLGVLWSAGRHQSTWNFLVLWFFLSLCVDSKKILKWLKSRITYPRTGYVAPPQADPVVERDPYTVISIIEEPVAPTDPVAGRASRRAIELEDFPLFLLMLWVADISWLLALLCLAAALGLWHRYQDDPPWFEIAGAAIAGLLVLLVNGPRGFGVFLVVFGTAGMVKGATLLIGYLRRHPAPQA